MSGGARRKAVQDALEWVHLDDRAESRPNQLSGGQSQRVAIARAVVKKPELVLADEPTANLDAENSRHILETMEGINRTRHDVSLLDSRRKGHPLLRRKSRSSTAGRPRRSHRQGLEAAVVIPKLAVRNMLGAGIKHG